MSAAPDNDATGQRGSSSKYLRIFGALNIKLVSLVFGTGLHTCDCAQCS